MDSSFSNNKIIKKSNVQKLVSSVDPQFVLEEDAMDILLEICQEFVMEAVEAGCKMSKLRNSRTVEVKDVRVLIERKYPIRVPGFRPGEQPSFVAPQVAVNNIKSRNEVHRQRLAALKKLQAQSFKKLS
eukprot:Sdes_comp9657_c0_seq1m1154